jgi:hypothetical protein
MHRTAVATILHDIESGAGYQKVECQHTCGDMTEKFFHHLATKIVH